MKPTADVLIVGSGAAGLTAALNLAETHKVAVIAKGALGDSATGRAQGGIAAVLEEGDSFEAHVNDTMIAGGGLNDQRVVEHVVEAAPRVPRMGPARIAPVGRLQARQPAVAGRDADRPAAVAPGCDRHESARHGRR